VLPIRTGVLSRLPAAVHDHKYSIVPEISLLPDGLPPVTSVRNSALPSLGNLDSVDSVDSEMLLSPTL